MASLLRELKFALRERVVLFTLIGVALLSTIQQPILSAH